MNLRYLILRLIRHFLPDQWMIFLKNHNLFIQPGLETIDPARAVNQYMQVLKHHGMDIGNKKVLVFGYGGNLAIGCELVQSGASKVFLVEQKGFSQILDLGKTSREYPACFIIESGKVVPNRKLLTTFHDDLDLIQSQPGFEKPNLILSNSVFEHVQNPQKIAQELAELSTPNGSQLHFIDLRDHYFKYPFEMLHYKEPTWKNWLNPTSNLNRLRVRDYRNIFTEYFHQVEIIADDSDLQGFIQAKNHIRAEFLSGNDKEDSTTLIHVLCSRPQ